MTAVTVVTFAVIKIVIFERSSRTRRRSESTQSGTSLRPDATAPLFLGRVALLPTALKKGQCRSCQTRFPVRRAAQVPWPTPRATRALPNPRADVLRAPTRRERVGEAVSTHGQTRVGGARLPTAAGTC